MMVAIGIVLLSVVVAAATIGLLIARAGRRAAIVAAIVLVSMVAIDLALASQGVLADWTRRPPPFMLAMAVAVGLSLGTALSPVGARIAAGASMAAIIGIQSFRLPLEIVMHHAATTGLMPVQMTYTGRNFDILTGALAVPVAHLASRGRASRGLIWAWNLLGIGLLVNILAIAVASTPLFAAFGPDRLNTWVADAPYVLLPCVLVPAAVFGHVLVWRKLSLPSSAA
jgi:hypothetical protein